MNYRTEEKLGHRRTLILCNFPAEGGTAQLGLNIMLCQFAKQNLIVVAL